MSGTKAKQSPRGLPSSAYKGPGCFFPPCVLVIYLPGSLWCCPPGSRLAAYTRLYPPPRQQQRAIAHHRSSSYLTGHPVLVGFLVCPSPVQTQRRHTTTSLSTTTRLLRVRSKRKGECYISVRCTGVDSGESGMLGLPDSGFSVCSSVSVKTPAQPSYAPPPPPFTDSGTSTLVPRVSAFALGSDLDRRPCHRHRIPVQVTCLIPNTHHEIPLSRNTLWTHFAAIGYRPFDGFPSQPNCHHDRSCGRLSRDSRRARVSSAHAPGASHRYREGCAALGSALCHRVWEPLYLPARSQRAPTHSVL